MWPSGRDGALAQLVVGQPAALQGQGGAPEIQERGEDNALVGFERGDGAFGIALMAYLYQIGVGP